MKTQNPSSFRVLNKFGSLVPLILLLTWACCYCLLAFFFSLGAATLLLLPVFSFLGEISPTGDPKKKSPVQPPQRMFFVKFFKTFAIFLRKTIKIARFRHWVRVTRLDLGRIQNKTLLSAQDSHHLMRIKAGGSSPVHLPEEFETIKRSASCYYFFLLTFITLLSILFFSLYCYYSSLYYCYSFPIALILFLLLLLFSQCCCSFPWMK